MTTPLDCPCGPENADAVTGLYPEGSQPENRKASIAAACTHGIDQLVMTGVLRYAIGMHFSDPANIINESLRTRFTNNVWQPREAGTGIVIESLHRWTPQFAEQRPAIILKENQWDWSRQYVGDKVSEDIRTGAITYGGFWVGSHTIFAVANEAAEAQTIGWEVLNYIKHAKAEIALQLDLQRLVPVSIGDVAALQESSEHYLVPIVVAYVVPDTWSEQPEAPRLKRVIWRLRDILADY